MKPDWDKLMNAFSGSPTVVIADVDCTIDSAKPVCEQQGINGYPTIKYFNEVTPKGIKYEGARDFKALKKFVKKTLKGVERSCDAVSLDGCFPEESSMLEKLKGESSESRTSKLKSLEAKLGGVLKTEERKTIDFEVKMLKLLAKSEKHATKGKEL